MISLSNIYSTFLTLSRLSLGSACQPLAGSGTTLDSRALTKSHRNIVTLSHRHITASTQFSIQSSFRSNHSHQRWINELTIYHHIVTSSHHPINFVFVYFVHNLQIYNYPSLVIRNKRPCLY